jgi:hypothetical protein
VNTLDYINAILKHADELPAAYSASRDLVFQAEDAPLHVPSVSWERRHDWTDVQLVPDLYFFNARGYEDYLLDETSLPAWNERKDQLIWRGVSTGILGLTMDNLPELARYRLCQKAADLGSLADCGMNMIVQAFPDQHDEITAHCEARGYMRAYLPMDEMRRYKLIVDIDGNTNSWNFLQKLRLGCCVLRVESDWRQWFSDGLQPWSEYVPVASDLSNLAERVDWCLSQPKAAQEIARRGRLFALARPFAREMKAAACTMFG